VGAASTFAGDGRDTKGVTIAMPLSAPSRIRVDGDSLREDSFILIRKGQPFTVASRQAMRWGGVTLPVDDDGLLSDLSDALTNCIERGKKGGIHTRTTLRYVSQVKLLISRLCVEDVGRGMLDTAVMRAAADEVQTLSSLLLDASTGTERGRVGRPRYNRDRIIRQALEVIEASRDKPLFIEDLCRATQVSERTLRNVFEEHFSVGPMRLLKLHRLCAIRAALLNAEHGVQQVGEIARHFGIWDLGTFAGDYRALFEELPSQTLHRPLSAQNRDDTMATWLGFAMRWSASRSDKRRSQLFVQSHRLQVAAQLGVGVGEIASDNTTS
jgi:AraC-like DNA-binding protein